MRNLQYEDTGHYSCIVDEQGQLTAIYRLYISVQSAPDVSVVSSSVSGHEGGDISVQCLYSSGYKNEPKQWCRYKDRSCYTVGRTDRSQNSTVQISDDGRRSFTVLMTGLRLADSGCSVSGHEGDDISVQCLYSSGYKNEPKQWCRYKDRSCYTVGRTDTSQNSSVQISEDGRRSFTVLMTGLRLTDSGWYFCSVGEKMHPVQLTVTEAKEDISETGHCLNNNNTTEVTDKPITLYELLNVWLPVSAALLLLLILVGVFIWRWRRRPKQDKHQIRDRDYSSTTDMIYSKPEDPVIYSTVNDENPNDINYYSTIDYIPGSEAVKPPAAPDVSVVNRSVSGHEGGDISVQCLYSSRYLNKIKQFCRYEDRSCYTVGRTDTSQNSSVQISDDGRGSFTVLMTGLRLTDSGWYFCSAGETVIPVQLTVEGNTEKNTNNELCGFQELHFCCYY
ncbi:hypothetical protein Q8A67_008582 [Cirrhinus molitorella]|uniref:Ig-like domain-containing protein n=1 Tax=Cirrhinus molitorella TaxID=172907 RepID=A0AA88PUM7_9TELE|nr:hypothetical protein Q8A67_008582 [Cirrhinus molitorella]